MARALELSTCVFSPCETYRYRLTHIWNEGISNPRYIMWIGLNPSIACESFLDPTLRRVKGYSQAWGYDGFIMTNLFAYRATDPRIMLVFSSSIGSDNDKHLTDCAEQVDTVVAMWGTHGGHHQRDEKVKDMFKGRLNTLKVTKDGHPSHCLYLPKGLTPIPFA